MNSYRQNSARKSRRTLIIATLVVLFLIGADLAAGGAIRGAARSAASVLWSAGSQTASAVGGSGFFTSRKTLMKENEALKDEVARQRLRIAELESLSAENDDLRDLVRMAEDVPGVGAPVISSIRSSPYGTFRIGAGEASGIAIGDLVVAASTEGRGFVVGRVTELSAHSALVLQVFAPQQEVPALVRKTPITAQGQGGGNARAEVPRNVEILEGDTVTSLRFRGFPIGIIGKVEEDTAGAHQNLYIGLPLNLAVLSFVYVIPSGI